MDNFHFSPRPNRAGEIQWQEWGETAFEQARREDKPILLDIGAVWCHWCHVMDETTYSDPAIIQYINEHLVPIRVENDQRPDVNRRYNLGGWPTTAFLTPEGEVLTGGTYFPPQQMRTLLAQLIEAYRQDKGAIQQKARELTERRRAAEQREAPASPITGEVFEKVSREVRDNWDPRYGGFGDAPKFPQTEALELALARHSWTGDPDYLPIVTLTLTKMAEGGVYDAVEGGFFRYSTTRDWSVPHFEKMLEDNARLLSLYLHAYQVTGRALFKATARSIVNYIAANLYDRGADYFYGSQDADEHYYSLPAEGRAEVSKPYVDRTLYSDWNALAASAFLEGSVILEDPPLRSLGLSALAILGEEMFRPGGGLYHFRRYGEVELQLPGQLSDQVQAASAFITAYETTGRMTYLTRVRILADLVLERWQDREHGGFFSEAQQENAPGLLSLPDKSLGENSAAAEMLVRLYRLTGEEKYRAAAERALAWFLPVYERYSFQAAGYALAVNRMLREPLHVTVVGPAADREALELLNASLREYAPARVVELLEPTRDRERLAALGYPPPPDGAQAYICVGQTCLPPVSEPRQVAEAVARARANIDTS